MPDITNIRNISSGAVGALARERQSNLKIDGYNYALGLYDEEETDSFSAILSRALDNISATNGYLSDAENEEMKWILGESENTHDLAIAMQKASTALQYTISIRDRVIAAYREIIQMQI